MGNTSHERFMKLALEEAKKSPPKPTNFCVGAVLVGRDEQILSTGYTLELEGNTHAEQCCFQKFASKQGLPEERIGEVLPSGTVLYTTMEPCNERLSGNLPCVDRIIRTQQEGKGGIQTVYSGVKEPEKFVGENKGRSKLESCGIQCVLVEGFHDEILQVATAGHDKAT